MKCAFEMYPQGNSQGKVVAWVFSLLLLQIHGTRSFIKLVCFMSQFWKPQLVRALCYFNLRRKVEGQVARTEENSTSQIPLANLFQKERHYLSRGAPCLWLITSKGLTSQHYCTEELNFQHVNYRGCTQITAVGYETLNPGIVASILGKWKGKVLRGHI